MMEKEKHTSPIFLRATQFLRGQSARIFKEVSLKRVDVIVFKGSEPHVAIISYEKYKHLQDEGKL